MPAYANGDGAWGPVVEGAEIGGHGEKRLEDELEVSGEGVPAPIDGFEAAGLAEAVLRNVVCCGYERPTSVQRYAMPIARAGRDLMACVPTGSGTTAAFCIHVVSSLAATAAGTGYLRRLLPSLPARPRALVLAPTREVADQINEEAKKFSFGTGLTIVVAHAGILKHPLCDLERDVDLFVATPGCLLAMVHKFWISLELIEYLVMDAVDSMLDMGFEPHLKIIVGSMGMSTKSTRQTLLFSARFQPQIQSLASDFLYHYISVKRIGSSSDLTEQKIEFVNDGEKRNFLLDLFQRKSVGVVNCEQPLTLIFVEMKREADILRDWLCSKGFSAAVIHGDKTRQERKSAMKSFKSGDTPIMVATDVASWDSDALSVAHVINYDLPKSIEAYVHRIERAVSAGKARTATAFFAESNHPLAKGLVELMTKAKLDVPKWLVEYANRPCYAGSSYGARDRRGSRVYRGGDYAFGNGGGGGCSSSGRRW